MTLAKCTAELQSVEVGDTTKDDSSNEDGYIIITLNFKKLIKRTSLVNLKFL